MLLLPISFLLLLVQATQAASDPTLRTLDEIEATLSTPVSLPAPPAPLKSQAAVNYMEANWSLWKDKIQSGLQYFSFVQDPYAEGTVLSVKYPKGSFGADGGGGAHFYSTALAQQDGRKLGSMLLSYEIAFQEGFNFRWGGKLPGLRGGNPDGCGGGLTADGLHCESTRLMFREYGAGEVYAYIPTTPEMCAPGPPYIECNGNYGTSLSRGSFYFPTGEWSKISLFIQLNSPASESNGVIQLFFNGELALTHEGLQIRASDKIYEGGLWFSSFFGGGNSSWSSPQLQRSYFKNFQLSGSPEFASDSALNEPAAPSEAPTTSYAESTASSSYESSSASPTSSEGPSSFEPPASSAAPTTDTYEEPSTTPTPTSPSPVPTSTSTSSTSSVPLTPIQASVPSRSSSPVVTTSGGDRSSHVPLLIPLLLVSLPVVGLLV